MSRRQTLLLAATASLAVLALYVATLAPGLVAIEDTPKFQFVGRILGSAHPPGYPLYVMTSHLFGLLPIGNLAWRINLMSAVCAALTVWCTQLAAVELGVSPFIAAAAGVGLATGPGFWFAATIAEVYSLHGTLLAAMTLSLTLWRRTGRTAWFFAAIACFSLGLGHHTSIVMTGPAVAVFAIMLAPRFALAPKTVASILGCFALGFAQYLFVLVRTRQGAWGEAPASNMHELWDVIRGARWASYVAPMSTATLTHHVPAALARLVGEMTWPAALLALAGVVTLGRRDRPSLAYLVLASTGVVLFSAFFAGQTDGFLQPAFVFVWLLAAVGLDALARLMPGTLPRSAAILAAALAALVVWRGATTVESRDLSHRRFEMRYFDALTRQVPERSAFLAEDFIVDRMVLYERFSDDTFNSRGLAAQVEAVPVRVREFVERGFGLFAFGKSASNLRRDGLAFEYAPWPLEYGSVRQFIEDQARGSFVAMAVPAMRLGAALTQGALPFERIGGAVPAPSFSNVVAIGVVGGASALQAEAPQQASAVVAATRGQAVAGTRVPAPLDVSAQADYDHASIRVSGREIVRSAEPVLAVWDRNGQFVAALALTPRGTVPMPTSAVSVYRLRGEYDWLRLGTVPRDLTRTAPGGLVMVRQASAESGLVLYAARRAHALAPRLFDVPPSLGALDVQLLAGGSAALRAALTRDGWPPHAQLELFPQVYRIVLPASAGTFALGLGGLPDLLEGRSTGAGEAVSVYGIDLGGQLEPVDTGTRRLHIARDFHQMFIGAGWSPVGADEGGGFVLSLAPDPEVLVPCGEGDCDRVSLQLWSAQEGTNVGLSFNGVALQSQTLHAGWQYCSWTIPAGLRTDGMNAVMLAPSAQVRLADLLVSVRTPAGAPARTSR